jgi:hypothetical protein
MNQYYKIALENIIKNPKTSKLDAPIAPEPEAM